MQVFEMRDYFHVILTDNEKGLLREATQRLVDDYGDVEFPKDIDLAVELLDQLN